MSKKKLVRSAIFIVPLLFIFSQCIKFKSEDPRGKAYAGSAACVSCHKNIYSSYLHTAHFMASQPASAETIQGSFDKGKNAFEFNPSLKVVMDKRDTGFFQTSYANGKAEQSQRFAISFGGIKGQTYAYWFANELFQLPISYVSNVHQWINSPGYDNSRVAFERMINIQCLDCHLSYAKQVPPDLPGFYSGAEGFERNSLVYSIDCERCHGPSEAHVKFQTENPNEKKAQFIVSVKSLTRAQKINMCAICHSGLGSLKLKSTFAFKPGNAVDTLMTQHRFNNAVDYTNIDVHGNQQGLLAGSKCFIKSNMDCNTCHNTHVNERDKVLLYANRCLTCHNTSEIHKTSGITSQLTSAMLTNNCISCHMPAFPSKLIIAGQSGALVHTHHIAIYPHETEKVLALIKSGARQTTGRD